MLLAINAIACQQEHPTKKTELAIFKWRNYCVMHLDAKTRYHASDMLLHIHSDASYLSTPRVISSAGWHFFLSSKPVNPEKPEETKVPLNGPVHSMCERIRNMIASTVEAAIGALYANTCKGEELCITLEEMGHQQLLTPIMMDTMATNRIVNDMVKQKRSYAIDMHFYWLKDRCQQGHFQVFWRP
jgi:hypothetical protein